MRVRTMIFAAAALAATGIVAPTPAQAAPVSAMCLTAAAQERTATTNGNVLAERLSLKLASLRQKGYSEKKIDSELEAEGIVLTSPRPAAESQVTPLSTNSIISVPAPTIRRDTCTSQYYVMAYWDFTSMSALQSDAGGCQSCAVGGDDGFGIALSRKVSTVGGYSVTTWGASSAYPASTSRMAPVDASTDGVGFMGQDRFCRNNTSCGTDYSFYHGQLVYTIGVPGCGYLQAYSKYGHSWNSSDLSGISIGIDSVGFSWSATSNRWERGGSAPSNSVRPC